MDEELPDETDDVVDDPFFNQSLALPGQTPYTARRSGPFLIGIGYVSDVDVPEFDDIQHLYDSGHGITDQGTWMMADAARLAAKYLGHDDMWNIDYRGRKKPYIQNIMYVAGVFPPGSRVTGMSVSFHQVMAPFMLRANKMNDDNARRIVLTWLVDARDRGWTRDELSDDVKKNSLPPSMREASLPEWVEPSLQLIVRPFDEIYVVAIDKANAIKAWLARNNAKDVIKDMDDIVKALKHAAAAANRRPYE